MIVKDANGFRVGIADSAGSRQDDEEINRLFAAAPDLLQALQDLFENCAMTHRFWGENCNAKAADAAIAAARAAIAKATGKGA